VLCGKKHLLKRSLPFLYGGDMIAEGHVTPDLVEYNDLPWKYVAGTPNILGVIASAQALRLILDLALGGSWFFCSDAPVQRAAVTSAMGRVTTHCAAVTARALNLAHEIPGLSVYGPPPGTRRSPLVAFNVAGTDPRQLASELNDLGVESRAGCHCATLAHRALGLTPPASCRLSFALYTDDDDVDRALSALRRVATGRSKTGCHA
jgi:cysteine desulfurase/selenocysteine lyase